MPRKEARIKVSIWTDPDFLALTIDAQWMYKMLCSQPNVSHAGVLTIPRREWANLASDEDAADRILAARKLLEDRRFIVVDDVTDELLIRSMIRTDVADGAPGTFRAAMDAAIAAQSPVVRAALYAELLRLDEASIGAKKAANRQESPVDAYRRALTALGPNGPRGRPQAGAQMTLVDAPEDGSHGMSHGKAHSSAHAMSNGMQSHGMSHGMGVRPGDGVGDGVGEPSVATHLSDPSDLRDTRSSAVAELPVSKVKRAQALARSYCDRAPLSNFPAVMKIARKAIDAGRYADHDIAAALARLADDGRSVTTESLRVELEGPPRRRNQRPTTDDHVATALAFLRPDGDANPGAAS